MLRINFGLIWPLDLVERLHGMADFDIRHIASTPPVWIRIISFLSDSFLYTTPPKPSDVTSDAHVTQTNMNVNIPTTPQPSDVTYDAHVTQINMNVNIPTPRQPSDVTTHAPQPSDVTSDVHVTD